MRTSSRDELRQLCRGIQKSFVHVETRDSYGTETELPHLARWRRGEPDNCSRRRRVRLDGERWRTFFDAFQHTAFRLETYPSYDVTSEREEYEGFLSSGSLSIPDDDPWLTRVRHFRATGRWIGRVHVLRRPLTDYLRYEFAVYRHTVAAGEDVRILDLTSQPNPGLPGQDFWLFDEISVVRMDYDDQGVQLGREHLEGIDPTPYAEWQRLALAHAQPYAEYVRLLA